MADITYTRRTDQCDAVPDHPPPAPDFGRERLLQEVDAVVFGLSQQLGVLQAALTRLSGLEAVAAALMHRASADQALRASLDEACDFWRLMHQDEGCREGGQYLLHEAMVVLGQLQGEQLSRLQQLGRR